MFKNINTKFILIIISLASIYGTNPFKILSGKTRSLATLTDIYFIYSQNLIFNSDNRWQFDIKYHAETELILDSIYTVPILYKGKQSKALCIVQQNFILNCFPDENTQTIMDLIQLNNGQIEGATINWKNLTQVYDIPINTSLKYEDSYNIKYHVYGNSKYWDFKVKIKENVLPENSIVKIDLFFSPEEKVVAKCKHEEELFLNCEFNHTKPNTNFLNQISPKKDLGSIDWENLEYNVTIPLYFEASNLWDSYNLELINAQWTYILKARGNGASLGGIADLITTNTKIKKESGEELIYFTKCYSTSIEDEFQCTVFGDNQDETDLVYVTKSKINDICTDWDKITKLNTDQLIFRNAELSFVKIYDHVYTGNSWTFKI